jgi:hypothetical protein
MKKEVKPSNCMAMASSMLSMIPMFIMFQGEIRNFVGHPFLPLESQHIPTIALECSMCGISTNMCPKNHPNEHMGCAGWRPPVISWFINHYNPH